jgi:hypothetical protein
MYTIMRRHPSLILSNLALLLFVVDAALCSAAGPQLTHTVTVTSTGFSMELQSPTESVVYQWVAPAIGSLYSVGTVLVTDSINGASPQGQITLSSGMDWIGPSEALRSIAYQSTSGPAVVLTFSGPTGTTNLTLAPLVDGAFAGISLSADAATIKEIHLGQLPSSLPAQAISVPYYSQAVTYIGSLELFENSYFDAFASNASTISTVPVQKTYYAVNENGSANPLKDIWKVSVSKSILNVLPYPEHPASPYMSQLAGRLFLDARSGSFSTIAAQVENLGDFGITHCVDLVADWQSFGLDNGFPAQYPASTSLGGDGPMKSIGAAARSNSCLFGLYENYTDYYPNYPGYTPATTMRNADGTQVLAWLNTVTGIQSFATKPGLFVPNAATQSPLIHQAYGTDATFIDVNSSATPWWRVDEDPSTRGSGSFGTYRDGSIGLWAYERGIEGGPVFGEGKYHWFWSGLLDGVEAQFGSESTPITNGLLAPLFVDFDLTRIHPLQVNYGMGYYDRWLPGGGTITSTLAFDAYRMQEVIFGHSPYLTDAFWPSVPRALVEQDLVGPLASRSALQTPTSVAYLVNGTWGDASSAAIAGDFSLAQVTYPNGDAILANSRPTAVTWNNLQIPQYGWGAKGTDFLAYTALLDGQIADYSQTPQSIYANARNQFDILSENTLATPSVAAFRQTAPNVIQIRLQWDVNTPQPDTPYQEFIHFVGSQIPAGSNGLSGVIGGAPKQPTETWGTGERVSDNTFTFFLPSTMPNGSYDVRVGLAYGSQRAVLLGNNDGNLRYTVGTIIVSNNGSKIAFTAIPISIPSPDPRLNSAGSIVDFGTIRTDGMVLLQQQTGSNSGSLRLSTYPRSRDVVVQIDSSNVAMPASVTCDNGNVLVPHIAATPYWQIDLRGRKYCTWNGKLP